jgi:hypothetical protein
LSSQAYAGWREYKLGSYGCDCDKLKPVEKLSTYVAAICCQRSAVAISGCSVEQSSWEDQGFVVSREVLDYQFENGVVIRRTIEQDNFPCEMACAECWITYEVISSGPNNISPARKTFENACRESFWLAYHTAE